MTNSKPTVAIISNTFSGYLTSHLLEKMGYATTVISTAGDSSISSSFQKQMANRIHFLPANPAFLSSTEALQPFFAEKIHGGQIERPPITLVDGEQKEFLGFGDSNAQSIHCLSQYHTSQQLNWNPRFWHHLSNLDGVGKVMGHSEISELHFGAKKLDKLVINGNQDVVADIYLFLIPPNEYIHLIPTEWLGAKIRSRISKSRSWSRVSLRMDHTKQHFSGSQLIFLNAGYSEVEPCVGQFHTEHSNTGERYFSTWETYLDRLQSEDPEFMASALKGIRRQIKKGLPQLLDDSHASITVNPHDCSELEWYVDSKESTDLAANLALLPSSGYPLVGLPQCISVTAASLTAIRKLSDARVTSEQRESPSLLDSQSPN